MQGDGAYERLAALQKVSCDLETVHHAHCVPMTALWPVESTYLLLSSKEAPAHVSNHTAVSLLPLTLPMIVSIRQVIVSTRHLNDGKLVSYVTVPTRRGSLQAEGSVSVPR